LKNPNPLGGPAVLERLRATGGAAFAVSTADAMAAADEIATSEGVFPAPECATTLAGLRAARARGLIAADSRVVLMITGSGLKSVPSFAPAQFPTVHSADQVGAAVATMASERAAFDKRLQIVEDQLARSRYMVRQLTA
jgi:threonine synthase